LFQGKPSLFARGLRVAWQGGKINRKNIMVTYFFSW
jgi:hypothetical protein